MQSLIGWPRAGAPWALCSSQLVAAGFGVGAPLASSGRGDITGHQGQGRGRRRFVVDELTPFDGVRPLLPLSPGRGAWRLVKVGPRGGRRVLKSTRAKRGRPVLARVALSANPFDAEFDRSKRLSDWLAFDVSQGFAGAIACAARARVAAGVQADADAIARLVNLCRGAAKRQADHVRARRGVRPSATSADDAAADGRAAILARFPRVCLLERNHIGARRIVLARCAGRAAFASFVHWARVGVTGATDGARLVTLLTSEALDGLHAAESAQFEIGTSEHGARWRAARWCYRVLCQAAYCQGGAATFAARASVLRAQVAARARARVVGALIFGASVPEACGGAGFDSVQAFRNSMRRAQGWQALAQAATGTSGAERQARAAMRRASVAWREAVRQGRRAGGFGVLHWQSAGAGVRLVGSSAVGVRPTEARTRALAQACYWRDRAARLRAANRAAWAHIASKLSLGECGDLRRVFGLVRAKRASASLRRKAR